MARRVDATAALANAVAELLQGRLRTLVTATTPMKIAALRNGEGEEDDDNNNVSGRGRKRSEPTTYVYTMTYLHLPGGVLILTLSLVMIQPPLPWSDPSYTTLSLPTLRPNSATDTRSSSISS